MILVITLIIPLIRFNQADALFNEGKYEEAMAIYKDIGGFSDSEQRITVLEGIKDIDNTNLDIGIRKILAAGVPVKLTYGMGGGDFSDTEHVSAPGATNNGGIELMSATVTSADAPEAVSLGPGN